MKPSNIFRQTHRTKTTVDATKTTVEAIFRNATLSGTRKHQWRRRTGKTSSTMLRTCSGKRMPMGQ